MTAKIYFFFLFSKNMETFSLFLVSMTRTEHDSYSVALPDRQQKALFALKTNALFDAVLGLNGEHRPVVGWY